jgi:hypothetical protein
MSLRKKRSRVLKKRLRVFEEEKIILRSEIPLPNFGAAIISPTEKCICIVPSLSKTQ